MNKIRIYNDQGREYFVTRPGQIVPAGHIDSETFQSFDCKMVAALISSPGNPWDEGSRDNRFLTLQPLKK